MQFSIEITCDNAAFFDEDGEPDAFSAEHEVCRILGEAICQVGAGGMRGRLFDVNGNAVGEWKFS